MRPDDYATVHFEDPVTRQLRDAYFVTGLVQQGRTQQRRQLIGRLNRLAELSTLRLEDLLAHDDPGVALRAIALVMSSSVQLSRVVELDERLGVLEQRLGGEGR